MTNINIHQAKAKLSRLIMKACEGEEIVITRRGRPVAKLVTLPPDANSNPLRDRKPGAWKGKISYAPDAFGPLTDQELKSRGFERAPCHVRGRTRLLLPFAAKISPPGANPLYFSGLR